MEEGLKTACSHHLQIKWQYIILMMVVDVYIYILGIGIVPNYQVDSVQYLIWWSRSLWYHVLDLLISKLFVMSWERKLFKSPSFSALYYYYYYYCEDGVLLKLLYYATLHLCCFLLFQPCIVHEVDYFVLKCQSTVEVLMLIQWTWEHKSWSFNENL